jgi:hypothetical protein
VFKCTDDAASFGYFLFEVVDGGFVFINFSLQFAQFVVEVFVLRDELRVGFLIGCGLPTFVIIESFNFVEFALLHVTLATEVIDSALEVLTLLFELPGVGFGLIEFTPASLDAVLVVIGLAFQVLDLFVVHLHFGHCFTPLLLEILLDGLDLLEGEL